MTTIQEFLTSSVENGNQSRSRVTLAKIDIKNKDKDAPRMAKQSIAVFNPLNAFLAPVITNAHKEMTDNKRHLLLLSELLAQVSNVETLSTLTATTTKAIKRLRFMFAADETSNDDILVLLAGAIETYRTFTKDASDKAIAAKVETVENFADKLQAVSFARFAENKAAQAQAQKLIEAQAIVETAANGGEVEAAILEAAQAIVEAENLRLAEVDAAKLAEAQAIVEKASAASA